MAKKKSCECIPNASKIANEITLIASNAERSTIVEDSGYISGMLFAVQETELVNVLDEFSEITDAAIGKDIGRFIKLS